MGIQDRNLGRMTTGIERVFRPLPDGLYREVLLHWVHYLNESGEKTSSKLQKQIEGQLYIAMNEDPSKKQYRSIHGEVEYTFPDGTTRRLVAVGMDYGDLQYGRGVR